MGDMDYEHERAELERKFEKFTRENPDHPAVIKAIACRIAASRKDKEPSQYERDWLDLALRNPDHPRVLRVRKVVADLAANRERHPKNGPESVEPFRLPLQMETVPWNSRQRHSVCEGASQSLPTTVEAEKARPFSPESCTSEIHWPMKTEHIDASQLATILSALRFFQENHAFAVARYAEYHFVTQRPLTVEEIETLCQTIIAAAVASLTVCQEQNACRRFGHAI